MKITEAKQKEARELAARHGLKELWINEKGEFFTLKSNASNSVANDKEKYAQVNIGADSKAGKTTNDLGKAAEVIAAIEGCIDMTEVEAIRLAEAEGKNRTSVIEAANKKIESLSKKSE